MLPSLEAFRAQARVQLPPHVFDYYDCGSWEEVTRNDAETAWQAWRFRPRVLRDVHIVDLATEVLGTKVSTPVLVAPTAHHGLADPQGEVATASGARNAGSLTVLSTRSSRRLEDVGAAAGGPWWFQAYLTQDRGITAGLVTRAAAAGATALVLTGDTPEVAPKPRAPGPPPVRAEAYTVNLSQHLVAGADFRTASAQDPGATLDTIRWIGDLSGLPVLVKGVLRGDDAAACLDAGAAGIIVSNHGGRQLDRSVPAAQALGEVCDAVAGRGEVYADGGLGDGLSILAALALGAHAVLIGRPVLWGLAAAGADGVEAVLADLTADLRLAMRLAGMASLADIDRSLLWPPA